MQAVFTGVLQDTSDEFGLPGRTGSPNGLAYVDLTGPPASAPLPAVGGLLLAALGGAAPGARP